ncbi:hypothetical protein [Bradyrhizobium sp. BR13661]|jgi:hypothetical protein|uniref:hypothetical protein n=1 Tax=Bradyrhizobium sp. BR13661 TaxID=2940622 RepID=UPI0024747E62|nr:hypothetical protein [Bradyrhizobium sp. BR13661]MDH6259684.1 hypothetical protein [Bradyrhizobium sp. BR13661]
MNSIGITKHAAARMSQRSILANEAELIVLIGTEVDDGYLVREKDYRNAEQGLKQLLQSFRRLVGKRLVVKNGQIVTAYRPSKTRERGLLRTGRDRNHIER